MAAAAPAQQRQRLQQCRWQWRQQPEEDSPTLGRRRCLLKCGLGRRRALAGGLGQRRWALAGGLGWRRALAGGLDRWRALCGWLGRRRALTGGHGDAGGGVGCETSGAGDDAIVSTYEHHASLPRGMLSPEVPQARRRHGGGIPRPRRTLQASILHKAGRRGFQCSTAACHGEDCHKQREPRVAAHTDRGLQVGGRRVGCVSLSCSGS